MNRKILIGIAGGALALVVAGGAVYAGPSLRPSLAAVQAATTTPQPSSNPATGGAARTGRARQPGKAALLTAALIKASADATATKPKDVLAALRDGKTHAQYATDHGKTAADVIAAARKQVQDRLSQAVGNGKLTQAQVDALLKQFDDSAPKLMDDANLGQQIRRGVARRHPAAAGLVKATADVTSTKPADVLAALKQGQSLAQYAQAHGKTADDILAKLREQGEQRLDKGLDKAKQLIKQPGLRGGKPGSAAPAATPSQ
jgi:uncharacterized ParB-like nuclease family protein